MHPDEVDVVIVGGGVVGLAAAHECSRAGRSTLLLERATFGHDRSSSKGATRLFRVLYAREHAARLAQAALRLWHDLEERAGVRLLDRTGILFYGVDGPETREGHLAACERVMEALKIPCRRHEGRDLERAFPALARMAPQWTGFFESEGAVIHAGRTLEVLARLAREQGAHLREETAVTGLRPRRDGRGVEVVVGEETVLAHRLILAPGPFANEVLAHLSLSLDLEIWQMTYAHFRVEPIESLEPVGSGGSDSPLWFHFGPEENGRPLTYYGFPSDPRTGRVKAGADYTFRTASDPRELDLQPDPRILERVSGFLARHLRGVDPEPRDPRACLYTMTRDFEPVLDFVPGSRSRRDVVLFAGGSGGAFKFAPLLGRALFELACEGKSRYDLRPWFFGRPAVRPRAA
jgi:glycine/D-amino acid oxidase-like deaminating enzyme